MRLSALPEEKAAVNVMYFLVWVNYFVGTDRVQIFQIAFPSFKAKNHEENKNTCIKS